MAGASTYFHRKLREQLEAAIIKWSDHMAQGGCEDYAKYREGVGAITAYTKVIELCEQIESELDD